MREIQVPARENDADALSRLLHATGEHGGERDGGAGFDHDIHAFPDEAHRAHNFFFRDGHNVMHAMGDDRERACTERGQQAVGDRARVELRVASAVAEAAEALGMSKRATEQQWTFAKAWLRRELSKGVEDDD